MNETIQNSESSETTLVTELRKIIQDYLENHQRVSLNGLSKKCQVSEPTLRRIMSGKIKTTPTLSTVVDILCTISKETKVQSLIKLYPGIIAEALKEGYSLLAEEEVPYQFSPELNEILTDEVRYIIFKLAANTAGVKRAKVRELFGIAGEEKLDELIARDLVYEELRLGERFIRTRIEGFSLGHEVFVSHFKACADFIDTRPQAGKKNNLYYNLSESINECGQREILNLQRQALKKIMQILNDDKYRGDIPVFVLSAIDSLDRPKSDEESLLH